MGKKIDRTIPVEYEMCENDVQRVLFIRGKLQTDTKWLMRGLVAIYRRQTADEKADRATRNLNSVGFSAFDADFLSGMAERVLHDNRPLTDNQLAATRKAMVKYARQLVRITKKEA